MKARNALWVAAVAIILCSTATAQLIENPGSTQGWEKQRQDKIKGGTHVAYLSSKVDRTSDGLYAKVWSWFHSVQDGKTTDLYGLYAIDCTNNSYAMQSSEIYENLKYRGGMPYKDVAPNQPMVNNVYNEWSWDMRNYACSKIK